MKLPILRPLIGWDKTEIMAEARRIRTLAISELPTRTAARCSPRAGSRPGPCIDDLRRIEIRLDAEDLAEELAAGAHEYRQSEPSNRTSLVHAAIATGAPELGPG